MKRRIALAAEKGCDAIDPDNVGKKMMQVGGFVAIPNGYADNYDNGNYFRITKKDMVAYVKKIAAAAHSHGMAMGLKNAIDMIPDVINDIEFAVNEECATSGECGDYKQLLAAGKPVFHVEYVYGSSVPSYLRDMYCLKSNKNLYSTISTTIKVLSLDGWVTFCDGAASTTATTYDGVEKGLIDCPDGN